MSPFCHAGTISLPAGGSQSRDSSADKRLWNFLKELAKAEWGMNMEGGSRPVLPEIDSEPHLAAFTIARIAVSTASAVASIPAWG